MDLYYKVIKILKYEYTPINNYTKLYDINKLIHNTKLKSNKITALYYSEKVKELYIKKYTIIDDISCYQFYCNLKDRYNYDLHGIYGYQVDRFLDAIFDYNISVNQNKFNLITGNGNVIKPKTIKYLKYFSINFEINNGVIKINRFI